MQDVQEGQPPRPRLQTQSGVLSQQTVAHRPNLTPRLAWPGHVHSVYDSFCSGSQVMLERQEGPQSEHAEHS